MIEALKAVLVITIICLSVIVFLEYVIGKIGGK